MNPKLECPVCHEFVSRVIDSRFGDGKAITRRRRCASCQSVFHTREQVILAGVKSTQHIGIQTGSTRAH